MSSVICNVPKTEAFDSEKSSSSDVHHSGNISANDCVF